MSPAQEKHRQRRLAFAEFIKLYPFTPEDLDGEEWRPIEGWDSYLVSNFGRVKSLKNCRGCAVKILRPCLNASDYLIVNVCKNGKMIARAVHRLVAKAFIPNPDNKPQVNHIDGCKINAYVGNLEWSTAQENTQHSFDTGLNVAQKGENSSLAKLTKEQVLYIRANPDNLFQKQLAAMFGVCKQTISDVQRGRKYPEEGGIVRAKLLYQLNRFPDNLRAKIREEYVPYSREFGTTALSIKYGICPQTVWNIINEK